MAFSLDLVTIISKTLTGLEKFFAEAWLRLKELLEQIHDAGGVHLFVFTSSHDFRLSFVTLTNFIDIIHFFSK